jgi:mono/diheme cytochrome c family protein
MLRALDRGLTVICVAAAAFVVVLLFAGPSLIGANKSNADGQTSGPVIFKTAGCGGCHTLKAAGASGSVGPNLDQLRPSAADVSLIVRSGRGTMPSFANKLSDAQIAAVAGYVSNVAGR